MNMGETVRANVVVSKMTWFARWNKWAKRRESMACITMNADDGTVYVTFTASNFADVASNANEAQATIRIEGKFKREQNYQDQPQVVLTHAKRI